MVDHLGKREKIGVENLVMRKMKPLACCARLVLPRPPCLHPFGAGGGHFECSDLSINIPLRHG